MKKSALLATLLFPLLIEAEVATGHSLPRGGTDLITATTQVSPYIKAIPDGEIPKGQTEAFSMVVWNAGSSYPYCEIYMTVNSGEETELGRGHDGRSRITVRLGSTYVLKMIVYLGDKGDDVREVAKITVVGKIQQLRTITLGKRPGAGRGSDNAVGSRPFGEKRVDTSSSIGSLPFFYEVRLVPQGDSLDLSFRTLEPSDFFIEVSKQTPVPNLAAKLDPGQSLPAAFPRGTQLAAFTLPGMSGTKKEHQASIRSAPGQVLEAETLYHYVITAKAPDGGFRRYVGKFGNVSRTVTVIWDRVKILEDSDPDGCGEINLSFWANHGAPGEAGVQINHLNDDSACTGSEYSINRQVVIPNAAAMLKLTVSGEDDDTTYGSFTGTGVDAPRAGPGENGDHEWNVATLEFDLNQLEINATIPFKLISMKPGNDQGDLMFEVHGRLIIARE